MGVFSKALKSKWLKGDRFLIIFLAIFYTVGLIGLSIPSARATMVALSPLNLLLTFVVLFISRKNYDFKYFLFLLICFSLGIAAEWIGVHTGLLFGEYSYGPNLGVKLDGIPYIIGVNWILMVVSSQAIARQLFKNKGMILMGAAGLMTLMDVAIEPVAVKLDYWSWQGGAIPFYNYLCWFAVSLPMHYMYERFKIHEDSNVARAIFWLLTLFFILLNCL
ncbi:MAG: carotenoid biosynthesis protein [Bacteroidetes bacterium]|nr:carotenoid biosynthesis protein [Bacteroidota bacterium]